MAFPTVAARNANAASAAATTWTADLPSGIAAGDLLIVAMAVKTTTVPTLGSGFAGWATFSGLEPADTGTAAMQTLVFYRIADGTESSPLSITGASCEWCARSWRISAGTFDPNTPLAFASAGDGGTGTTNPDPPSLNPADWGTEDTLWIAIAGGDDATAGAWTATPPTNYSQGSYQVSTGGTQANRAALATAERELNAASEDPGTFTRGSANWSALTLAVRPYVEHPQPVTILGRGYQAAGTTLDISVTIPSGVKNGRIVVPCALELSAASISGVVIDPAGVNTALTRCTDGTTTATQNEGSVGYTTQFSLIQANFPSAGTYTIRITASTSTEIAGFVLLVQNTDQTQNVSSVAVSGATSTSTTSAPTLPENGLVIAICYKNNTGTPLTSLTAVTTTNFNMMPAGVIPLPTNGAMMTAAYKGVSTQTGAQNVIETVPGSVRLSLTTIALKAALSSTVAGSLGGLTAAISSDIQDPSATIAGVLPGLVGAVSSTQTLPSTIGRPKRQGSSCGSSTLNGNGATTAWPDHFRTFLQGINAASTFLVHAASGLSTWSHLPTGTTGQPAGAPAVDTARNITTCIADAPDFIIVNTNSDWTAGTVGLSIADADMDNVGGYVDLYLIPNLLTMRAACLEAKIPMYVTTGQPVDTGASAERTAFLLYAKSRIEEVFSGYTINFWDVLIEGGGDLTLKDSYSDDDVHPNDTATPLLSDVVEALNLHLVTGGNLPGLVGDIDSDTLGALVTQVAGVLPGLTGAVVSTQTLPSTIAGVLGGLTADIRTNPTVASGGGSMRGRRSRVRRR